MLNVLLAIVLAQSSSSHSICPASMDQAAKANRFLSQGDASAARDAFESILKREPANPAAQDGEVRASERLALEARAAKDMNSALGALLRARELVPENARLLYDLGVLEEEIGLYHDADTAVTHLFELLPDDPKTLYLAARVKLDLGQIADAEKCMRRYLEAHPDDATAHYGLGRILRPQQPDAAKKEFRKAIELKPTQTESYFQLGQIALQAGEYEAAIDEDAHVLSRNLHHGGALTDTGIAYFRLKQYEKAEQHLKLAVTFSPDYQPAHYYLGLVLARLGRLEDSNSELAEATKLADEQNKKESQGLLIKPLDR